MIFATELANLVAMEEPLEDEVYQEEVGDIDQMWLDRAVSRLQNKEMNLYRSALVNFQSLDHYNPGIFYW